MIAKGKTQKSKQTALLVVMSLFLMLGGSCLSEEKFETAAGDRLTFSTDTLRFDTVLVGVGTSTRRFTVYNPNNDGVSITNIGFLNGESHGFRVNVDGVYINNGLSQSIDCRPKDSLQVFVEMTPESYEGDTPHPVSATLIFTLANNTEQKRCSHGEQSECSRAT